jgi:hypothetical protein
MCCCWIYVYLLSRVSRCGYRHRSRSRESRLSRNRESRDFGSAGEICRYRFSIECVLIDRGDIQPAGIRPRQFAACDPANSGQIFQCCVDGIAPDQSLQGSDQVRSRCNWLVCLVLTTVTELNFGQDGGGITANRIYHPGVNLNVSAANRVRYSRSACHHASPVGSASAQHWLPPHRFQRRTVMSGHPSILVTVDFVLVSGAATSMGVVFMCFPPGHCAVQRGNRRRWHSLLPERQSALTLWGHPYKAGGWLSLRT